jgi:hypothetical protein
MQTLVLSEYESRRHQTDDVIRAFNRDTHQLAALLLGAMGSAILVLGILTREREPNAADLPGKELLTSRDPLPNANPPMLSQAGTLNGESSVHETASELTSTKGPAVADTRLQENSFPQMEIPALTQTPVFGRMTQVNNPGVQDKDSRCSPRVSQGAPRIFKKKLGRISYTSSGRLRFVGLGSRLVALWHQDVARAEPNWPPFLNRSKEYQKGLLSGNRKSSPSFRASAITCATRGQRTRVRTHRRTPISPGSHSFRFLFANAANFF